MSLARLWQRDFGLDRIVWVLFFGNLISAVGRFMMRPFMTMYIYDRFHVPLTQLGWYVGLSSLAGIVFNTLAGTLADQVGRRPVMAGSLLLSGLFILGYTVTHSLAAFTLLFILHGAVSALFFPASSAAIADVTPSEQRLQAFGLTRIAVNTGAVVGPMTAGFILAGRSYHTAFLVTALCDLFFLALVLALVPETRPRLAPVAGGDRPVPRGGYGEVMADGFFLLFILVGLLVSVSYSQLESTLPLHLTRELGLPVKVYASLLALNGALVVLLQAPATALVSRWRTGRTLALSSALYAVGFGSYAFLRSFAPLAAMMVVITLGEVISMPSFSKFVADVSPTHLRGRYMAASGLGWAVAGVVGPIAGTAMMGAWGGGSVWVAAGLVCAAAAGLYLMLENALTRRRTSGINV
ncbi:MAG: MDR family MFS transporter [Chitinophagales bacterium]